MFIINQQRRMLKEDKRNWSYNYVKRKARVKVVLYFKKRVLALTLSKMYI